MTWNCGGHLSPHTAFPLGPGTLWERKQKTHTAKEETRWFLSYKLVKQAASKTGGSQKKGCHSSARTRHGDKYTLRRVLLLPLFLLTKKNNLQKVGAQRKGARGPPRPPQPRPEGPAGPGTHRSGPGQAAAPQWRPRSALTEGPFPPPGSGLRLFLLLLLFSFLLLLLLFLFLCLLLLLFPLLRRACWETEAAGPQGEGGLGCGDRRGGSGFPLRESGVRRDVGINPSLWGWGGRARPVPGSASGRVCSPALPGCAHLAVPAPGTSRPRSSRSISARRSNSCSRVCRLQSSCANRASSHSSLLSTLQRERGAQGSAGGLGPFCPDSASWAAPEPLLGVRPRFGRTNTTESQEGLAHLFGHSLMQRS